MNARTAPPAYPLAWPIGKKRTDPARQTRAIFGKVRSRSSGVGETAHTWHSKDKLTVAEALSRLQRELDLLKAVRPVCSTNVELRVDGWPRSDRREPQDSGVAVYFTLDGDPVTLACDRYDRVADNITAIAKHIEASRAIERYGVGTLHEIFRGFTALPPAMAVDDWREALLMPRDREEAEQNYRDLISRAHPDVGGTHAEAARLNAAIAKAREVFAA